jgi:hypothetical protein
LKEKSFGQKLSFFFFSTNCANKTLDNQMGRLKGLEVVSGHRSDKYLKKNRILKGRKNKTIFPKGFYVMHETVFTTDQPSANPST